MAVAILGNLIVIGFFFFNLFYLFIYLFILLAISYYSRNRQDWGIGQRKTEKREAGKRLNKRRGKEKQRGRERDRKDTKNPLDHLLEI